MLFQITEYRESHLFNQQLTFILFVIFLMLAWSPIRGHTSEIQIMFGKAPYYLPGTLTLPNITGCHPCVILIHGSGPGDRDETTGVNKPFRDIASGLQIRRIATFRYPKRTRIHSHMMAQGRGFTVFDETVEDASLALDAMTSHKNIDHRRIFVLGHSLGGMLIPKIDKLNPVACGYILLAAPARPLHKIVFEQLESLAQRDGILSAKEGRSRERAIRDVKKIERLTRVYSSRFDRKKRLKRRGTFTRRERRTELRGRSILLGAPVEYWVDLTGYQPASELIKVKQPCLIIQGERDYQTTLEDFRIYQHQAKQRDDFVFKSYSGLNHIFISGTAKSTPDEYKKPGHFDPGVIDDIASWINKVSAKK